MNRSLRCGLSALFVVVLACGNKSDDDAKKDGADTSTASTSTTTPTSTTAANTATAQTTATATSTAVASATPSATATATGSTAVSSASGTPATNPGDPLAGYTKFVSAAGHYEVMFPSAPAESEKKLADGSILHLAVSEKSKDAALTVTWQETKNPQALEKAKEATKNLLDGATVTPVKVNGKYDGVDVVGIHKDKKKPWRSRLFVAEGRMYQISEMGLSDAEGKAFADSFKLTSGATTADTGGVPAICDQAFKKMTACAAKLGGAPGKAMRASANALESSFKKVPTTPEARKALELSCKAAFDAQKANPLCK